MVFPTAASSIERKHASVLVPAIFIAQLHAVLENSTQAQHKVSAHLSSNSHHPTTAQAYVPSTNALSTRAAECERWINGVLDVDQSVQNHGPALGCIDIIILQVRFLLSFPSVDLEFPHCRLLCEWVHPEVAQGERGSHLSQHSSCYTPCLGVSQQPE